MSDRFFVPKEAAEKLAQDFGLIYDSQAPPRRRYVRQKNEAQKFWEDRQRCYRVPVSYTHLKTGKAARTVKEKVQQAGAFVMRHKKGFLMAGVLFLITCMLMNTMSSCSMMAQSIGSVLSGTTYPSDDPEMLAVEADYAAREAQLQAEIDNIESSHPGYDLSLIHI